MDPLPQRVGSMSAKLIALISERGLTCLRPILEQLGILTYTSLGSLGKEELDDICMRIRIAGFGLGHGRTLRELCRDACSGSGALSATFGQLNDAPQIISLLSGKGVVDNRKEPLAKEFKDQLDVSVKDEITASREDVDVGVCELSSNKRDEEDISTLQRAAKRMRASSDTAVVSEPMPTVAAQSSSVNYQQQDQAERLPLQSEETKQELFDVPVPSTPSPTSGSEQYDCHTLPSRIVDDIVASKLRVARDSVDEVLVRLKAAPAEIVRYRDKVTGKMSDARIPVAVLTLLRLHAKCSGKPISEERLARLAVEAMEEHGYDPIRTVSSLSPASLQCPKSAMRVLGTGYAGVVFLDEETGTAVKVWVKKYWSQAEYDVFCIFADAGLAVRPIGLYGPQAVPGGFLCSLHMETIECTLSDLLRCTKPRGQRHGLAPIPQPIAHRIGKALARTFQQMWDNSLVHGDLHLQNLAVKNHETQPLVQLIDFGRSARSIAASQSEAAEALRGGHEYDVFRLLTGLWESFDEWSAAKSAQVKQCEKEMREIQRGCNIASQQLNLVVKDLSANESELHDARQIAGLHAYVIDELKALEQVESAYNSILAAVVEYACAKLDLAFYGVASLSNRHMRQAIAKRLKQGHNVYFKSDLFWGEVKVPLTNN